MKIVMTLLARNEADVVDAQLAFHLNAGVDFVVATDNRSEDGTPEILERYERAGYLRRIREERDDMRQDEWVTRMARLAAAEHEADWVINTDADEFWWPRGGTLKDVLALVPERYGVVRGCWRHFLLRPDEGAHFAERMTVRLCTPAHPGDKETIYHAHQKVAHRARADVEVEEGNHDAEAPGLEPLRSWLPIEVLHFSFRSFEQLARKARIASAWGRGGQATLHNVLLHAAFLEGTLQEHFDSLVVSDDELDRGLASGTLAIDTRLRDALRLLRRNDGSFAPPDAGARPLLRFDHPDVGEDAAFAAEASALAEIEGGVRAEQRVEALEQRLMVLERSPVGRLATRGRILAGRLRRGA